MSYLAAQMSNAVIIVKELQSSHDTLACMKAISMRLEENNIVNVLYVALYKQLLMVHALCEAVCSVVVVTFKK